MILRVQPAPSGWTFAPTLTDLGFSVAECRGIFLGVAMTIADWILIAASVWACAWTVPLCLVQMLPKDDEE